MPSSSNISAAAACYLLGSAGFQVDTAHSFLTSPRSLVRGPAYYGGQPSAFAVTSPSSCSATPTNTEESNTVNGDVDCNSVVDDLWTEQPSMLSAIADKDARSLGIGVPSNDLQDTDDPASTDSTKGILIGGTVLVLAAAGALSVKMGNDLGLDLELGQLIADPSTSFDAIVKSLGTMDPQIGMLYFGAFYILAEILAIPAVPLLTASSGYLFGLLPGTATCLLSAAIAASISFVIGRTLLRGYVEAVLADNPKFRSMDRAIEKEGFKLMLLLRLSPLFPFALSNYLYGASSIQFVPYFFGTLLGFAPGTFAYVYAGRIGKAVGDALTVDNATSEPWYVYVGGMVVVVSLLKIAGDVATGVIDSMEEEDGL